MIQKHISITWKNRILHEITDYLNRGPPFRSLSFLLPGDLSENRNCFWKLPKSPLPLFLTPKLWVLVNLPTPGGGGLFGLRLLGSGDKFIPRLLCCTSPKEGRVLMIFGIVVAVGGLSPNSLSHGWDIWSEPDRSLDISGLGESCSREIGSHFSIIFTICIWWFYVYMISLNSLIERNWNKIRFF